MANDSGVNPPPDSSLRYNGIIKSGCAWIEDSIVDMPCGRVSSTRSNTYFNC